MVPCIAQSITFCFFFHKHLSKTLVVYLLIDNLMSTFQTLVNFLMALDADKSCLLQALPLLAF